MYEGNRSHDDVAMIGLGREMQHIVQANANLHTRLVSILNRGIAGESRLADLMVMDSSKESVEQKKQMLKNLLQGLNSE